MNKILCSIDDTEVSEKVIKFALDLAKSAGVDICFVHVSPVTNDDLHETGALDVVILEEVSASNHRVLKNAQALVLESGFKNAQFVIIEGHDFAEKVVEHALEIGCDHIITGSTGRVGIPRLILGSVASEIIQKAYCPVTVVR